MKEYLYRKGAVPLFSFTNTEAQGVTDAEPKPIQVQFLTAIPESLFLHLTPKKMHIIYRYWFCRETTYEQIGDSLEITRQAVHFSIKENMTMLWRKCPQSIKDAYPLEELIKGKREKTPEIRARISAGGKGKKHNIPPETKERMRNALRNRVVTQETRQKLRLANTGKTYTVTIDTRKRIGAANRNRVVTFETKAKMKTSQQARRQRERDNKSSLLFH